MVYNISMITKEHIESLGWEVEEIDDQLWMIKDFISESQAKEIIDLAESTSEEGWTKHYMDGIREFALRKFKSDDIDALLESGKLEITWKWVDKNIPLTISLIKDYADQRVSQIVSADERLHFNGVGTIQRQYEGAELVVHVDNHTDPSLEWAVIIYVNDDYTDGELIFPDRGIEIKPPARALLIFPTHDGYRHGVKPPGPGPKRYVLPSFVGVKGFWQNNKF